MCLAIPGRVTSIDGFQAVVEMGGVQRTIGLALTPEVQVGDYVYVHAGYAISVVDEEVALESLRLLRELAESYPEEVLYSVTGDASSPPGT
ncbi:MAG TPA: HypC/HybG/HupF family hydrogenase formation chaperone [Anaerolineae bacterium]|nr:HypC/HybG/HupF family hydrogenase formation chaperone [Anaerolineae bacterium]